MTLAPSVHHEVDDVIGSLADLGLTKEHLRHAAERWLATWASHTAYHPATVPGVAAWGEAVCALREALCPLGWESINEQNLPMVVDPTGKIAIVVNSGDHDTGRSFGNPRTSHPKGERTRMAVLENLGQANLFESLSDNANLQRSGHRQTWILLVFRDDVAMEVRSELSRPITMDDTDCIDGWTDRIILEKIRFGDDSPTARSSAELLAQTPVITVEIKKRA